MSKLTTDDFIKRAFSIHNGKYSYEHVVYFNTSTKVCITCHKHGDFWQTPNNHLYNKRGCPECAKSTISEKSRFTISDFIRRSTIIHGNRYDYSLVDYKGATVPVNIKCPKHGLFKQKPHHHFNGHGCPECKKESISIAQSSDKEQFIKSAILVHGQKYDYHKVIYTNAHEKVCIICHEHGEFWQRPNGPLNGYGCSSCAITGLDRSWPGFVYVIADGKVNPTIIKIGVTNNIHRRIQQLKRNTPFTIYKILQVNVGSGQNSYEFEQHIHREFQQLNAGLTGFDGCTEWFYYSPEILDRLKIILDGLQSVGLSLTYEKKT